MLLLFYQSFYVIATNGEERDEYANNSESQKKITKKTWIPCEHQALLQGIQSDVK
jgi:hypothetical protein